MVAFKNFARLSLIAAMGLQGCLTENGTKSESASTKLALLTKYQGQDYTCIEYGGTKPLEYEAFMKKLDQENANSSLSKVSKCSDQAGFGKCDYVFTRDVYEVYSEEYRLAHPEIEGFIGDSLTLFYYIHPLNYIPGMQSLDELKAKHADFCQTRLLGQWTNF